jgi:hypothetical protein
MSKESRIVRSDTLVGPDRDPIISIDADVNLFRIFISHTLTEVRQIAGRRKDMVGIALTKEQMYELHELITGLLGS